jgi:hypothetical protein
MAASAAAEKKRIETLYLEEARRVSTIFPSGELIPHERPDFLIEAKGRTIGIEVTELCREEERADGGKLSKVAGRAKALYDSKAGALPVDVSAAFTARANEMKFHELASSLADFVYSKRANVGASFRRDLPNGYCHIGLFKPLNHRWRIAAAFDVAVMPKQLLADRIAEKNERLSQYRDSAAEVWLVIVNDQFLGHGEVYARPDDLANWKFAFDFDKVLLFSREPNGRGQVIEVQRANGNPD